MRRWTLRILLCLFLGAVSTIAVAWGLAMGTTTYDGSSVAKELFVREQLGDWRPLIEHVKRYHLTGDFDVYLIYYSARRTLSGTAHFHVIFCQDTSDEWEYVFKRTEWGLPFRALYGEEHQDDRKFESRVSLALRKRRLMYGIPLGSAPTGYIPKNWLPLHPIWSGFLIDALFFAAIWFGSLFGIASLKRAIRTKRGRCPKCGYDLRGHARHVERGATVVSGFPECGWNR